MQMELWNSTSYFKMIEDLHVVEWKNTEISCTPKLIALVVTYCKTVGQYNSQESDLDTVEHRVVHQLKDPLCCLFITTPYPYFTPLIPDPW